MTGMDDLITWLRAQLDEDERVAREATAGPWVTNGAAVWRRPDDSWDYRRAMEEGRPIRRRLGVRRVRLAVERAVRRGRHGRMPFVMVDLGEVPELLNAQHIARWDPARVLAEVDAKRRILDALEPEARGESLEARFHAQLIRLLAMPYAGRPGYLDEWRL